ncbi:hypothetical protein H0H87_005191 [Tephrocybe sp. NHM501043]|nr:hypothetical protein H0H87_005191 [Tephrocybe sp. NHM501043]
MFKKRHDGTEAESPSFLHSPPTSQAPLITPSRKRVFHPSQDSPDLTPSQKRLKLIQDALSTPSKPPQLQQQSMSLMSSSTPPRSQERLKNIQLALSSTKGLGWQEAPSTPSKPSYPQERPSNSRSSSTPSHRRLEDIQMDLTPGKDSKPDSVGRPSPTPAQTISHTTHQQSGTPTASNFSGKVNGKEDPDAELWGSVTPSSDGVTGVVSIKNDLQETVVGPSRVSWRSDDVENPFDSVTRSQLSNSTTKPDLYVYATAPLNVTPIQSSQTIKTMIRNMEDIPRYVEKLERKLLALERSNNAKALRISKLEELIERSKISFDVFLQ